MCVTKLATSYTLFPLDIFPLSKSIKEEGAKTRATNLQIEGINTRYDFVFECFLALMGNCLFGSIISGEVAETIQVVSGNGGIMEFQSPVTAGIILEDFPCHAVVNSDDLFWKPLSNNEELHPGVLYLLLPLHTNKVGHVRSKSIPISTSSGGGVAPFRMSFDRRQNKFLRRNSTNVFSRRNKGGRVWKVKLTISSQQLLEILSEEVQTRELIENVRIVAKCGSAASEMSFSDQWSIASSTTSANID